MALCRLDGIYFPHIRTLKRPSWTEFWSFSRVSLEDLYNGKTTKLQLSKNVLCSTCNGWVCRMSIYGPAFMLIVYFLILWLISLCVTAGREGRRGPCRSVQRVGAVACGSWSDSWHLEWSNRCSLCVPIVMEKVSSQWFGTRLSSEALE